MSNDTKPVLTSLLDGVFWITINRPKVGNSLDAPTYRLLIAAVAAAAANPAAKLTGTGKFFSTGADVSPAVGPGFVLSYLTGRLGHYFAGQLEGTSVALTAAIASFHKPFIAALNGLVVGWSAAVLGLFDVVYAAESATFIAPFMALGLAPEGLSSVTLPLTMGPSLAKDVLLLGRKLSSAEMVASGFASRVLPDANFREAVHAIVVAATKDAPAGSLTGAKRLLRSEAQVTALVAANKAELVVLEDRFKSGEPVKRFTATAKALAEKKKLKSKL